MKKDSQKKKKTAHYINGKLKRFQGKSIKK